MRIVLAIAAALFAACTRSAGSADQPGGVGFTVAPATVAPGGSVTLTLRNDTTVVIGYNLCTSGLERRAGGGWEAVPEDRMCTMELRMLGPGAEDRFPIQLPQTLTPGEYRYSTTVHIGAGEGAGRALASNAFRVR